MHEIWKSLNNTVENGDFYEVSNLGNVRSIDKIASNSHKLKGKQLSIKIHKNGYREVNLKLNGKQKIYKVHRLVALAFIHNPENKPEVNHIDGEKGNNAVLNLEWATGKENQQHAIATGLRVIHGENNPSSKLVKGDIVEIRKLYKTGNYTLKELSDIFNITFQTISSIVNYKTWKSV